MTCWPRTVITSVMNFAKGLVCQNFQVITFLFCFCFSDYPKEFLKLESVPCLKINWPAVECDLFVLLL